MTELSRDAMQLLELAPRWELRPEYRPVAQGNTALMIVGLAHSPSGQGLWLSMAKAMIDMGFPRSVVEGAVMMASPQLDRVVSALLAQRPVCLLAFGGELIQGLQSTHAASLQDARIVTLESIDSMISTPKQKAAAWSTLAALRISLGLLR